MWLLDEMTFDKIRHLSFHNIFSNQSRGFEAALDSRIMTKYPSQWFCVVHISIKQKAIHKSNESTIHHRDLDVCDWITSVREQSVIDCDNSSQSSDWYTPNDQKTDILTTFQCEISLIEHRNNFKQGHFDCFTISIVLLIHVTSMKRRFFKSWRILLISLSIWSPPFRPFPF